MTKKWSLRHATLYRFSFWLISINDYLLCSVIKIRFKLRQTQVTHFIISIFEGANCDLLNRKPCENLLKHNLQYLHH